MDEDQALSEALAHIDELRGLSHAARATALRDYLKARGFTVQPASAPILNDCSPASLYRIRRALGLTIAQLAQAAGLREHTVSSAELGTKRPHASTLKAIAEALARLGALATRQGT